MAGGENYARNHLSNNDYYAVGETVKGQWMGHGAELLGLQGEVTMEQFDAIRQGNDPKTGEYLRLRQNVDRYDKDGHRVAIARNLYDFTVSAPKDLSIQALEDPRLLLAHDAGVRAIAAELEGLAGASVRMGGASHTRITSNLVIARYDHDSSRALDPQIHSHLVAGNLTYDGEEGHWKVLNAVQIYAQHDYLTEVYRNAAAKVVTSLGYQIEDRSEHGRDNGFGIVGIKESSREKFSQRSEQRDAAIAEFMEQNGRKPSNGEIAMLVRETRDPKLKEISTPEVKARQYARLDADEAHTLKQLRQTAIERGSLHSPASAEPSLSYAGEHIFERVSVAKDYELKTEALRHGRGRVELRELKAVLQAQIATGSLLSARGEVATQDSLQREREMVSVINRGIGSYEALGRGLDFVPAHQLRPEQKAAVQAALETRDFAFNVKGAAGVGKTALLQEVRRGLMEARRGIVAVAPSASAVNELQKVGFSEAITIARLLVDSRKQEELRGQVLIIDEAGMVGSKDMAGLLRLSREKGARILYSGDTAQIKSVSEGDALRVLERESKLNGVSLRQVQRQSNAEYRAAVEALRVNPADGYQRLEKMGAIREVDWRLVGRETSKAYREAAAVLNSKGEKRSVLVVAGTHDSIKSITHAIRADRKAAGEITDGEMLVKHSALNWTEAQKKQTKRYQPGLVLEFHKAVKGIDKNESLEVVSADKNGVKALKANGQKITLTHKQVKAYGVFEKETMEVSAGDRLLLQANWREKDFKATNGELVTVAAVDQGRIKLEDGRELPAGYRQFTSGYAVTAHVSQGKTTDWVVSAPDGMKKDLAYVAWTRGKEGLTIITSDKTTLEQSIGMSGDRQSAMELARQSAASLPAKGFAYDDLFHSYQMHQQAQQLARKPAQQEQVLQKEITKDAHYSISL